MVIIKGDFSGKNRKQKNVKDRLIPLYQLHVSLAFSEPLIWRRILVPGELTLLQLHEILQLCMGWSGDYNHQFYVGKIFYNASPSVVGGEEYYEGNFRLLEIEEAMRWCFTYMYDAGDGWEHEIVIEGVEEVKSGTRAPQLVDGEWAAPPEEIGSVHAYAEVVSALENPERDGSRELIEHHGVSGFDPYRFEREIINEQLEKITSTR